MTVPRTAATHPNDPAFPVPFENYAEGLTKREVFAMTLTAALVSEPTIRAPQIDIARAGVQLADALIATLNEVAP